MEPAFVFSRLCGLRDASNLEQHRDCVTPWPGPFEFEANGCSPAETAGESIEILFHDPHYSWTAQPDSIPFSISFCNFHPVRAYGPGREYCRAGSKQSGTSAATNRSEL